MCLAAAGPAPFCGPLPFQTGNQPRVPASCRAVRPPPLTSLPRAYGVTLYPVAGLALQLRPDYSALAPKAWHILALLRKDHRPFLRSPASSLAPPR